MGGNFWVRKKHRYCLYITDLLGCIGAHRFYFKKFATGCFQLVL
ncbi:NINE protein [Paenibacillus sp. V4I3]